MVESTTRGELHLLVKVAYRARFSVNAAVYYT